MLGRRAWTSVGLLLLLAFAGATGCQRNQPPAGPPADAAQPYSTSFSARGWSYHFRPVRPGAAADEGKAREVWRDLFPGMAKDPKTRELLDRLHAGLPVALVVLDAKQAGDDEALRAPPPDGYAIAMRVADLSRKEERSGANAVPVRVIAYGHVVLVEDAARGAAPNLGALAEELKSRPLPGEPLSLAMQDYVLRHAPGWAVLGGPISPDEKLPAGVKEQRQDLDRRIKDCAERAAAYYGGLRKRR
jgi:hypothetical protein